MCNFCRLIWCALVGLFQSRASLEAENLVLRHQLNVLRRKSPKGLSFSNIDRLFFAGLYGLAPGVLSALTIVTPETVIRCIAQVSARIGDGGRDRVAAGRGRRQTSGS